MSDLMEETSRAEAMLEPLIREHGIEKVRSDLNKLIPRSHWQTWQSVVNLAENVNRRIQIENQNQNEN